MPHVGTGRWGELGLTAEELVEHLSYMSAWFVRNRNHLDKSARCHADVPDFHCSKRFSSSTIRCADSGFFVEDVSTNNSNLEFQSCWKLKWCQICDRLICGEWENWCFLFTSNLVKVRLIWKLRQIPLAGLSADLPNVFHVRVGS